MSWFALNAEKSAETNMKNEMKEDIKKLIEDVCAKWDYYKSKEVGTKLYDRLYDSSDYTEVKTLNGYTTCWDNPKILWLMVNINGGGYDESGYQIGLTREGKIVWEYDSHCSCNTFVDSTGEGTPLDSDGIKKHFELRDLPEDWEKIIKCNLEEILKL